MSKKVVVLKSSTTGYEKEYEVDSFEKLEKNDGRNIKIENDGETIYLGMRWEIKRVEDK